MSNALRFKAKNGLDNGSNTIINVTDPVNAQDVATKNFSTNASNLASGTVSNGLLPAVISGLTSVAATTFFPGTIAIGTTVASGLIDLGNGTLGGRSLVWGGSTGVNQYAAISTTYSAGSLMLGSGVDSSTSVSDGLVSSYGGATSKSAILVRNGNIGFLTSSSTSVAKGTAVTLTEAMRVTSNATVLIGTTTDDGVTALQVSGNAKVSGTFNATGNLFGTTLVATADTGRYGSNGLRLRDSAGSGNGSDISLMPNGTGGSCAYRLYNSDDTTGTNLGMIEFYLAQGSTTASLQTASFGTGTAPTLLSIALNTSVTGTLQTSGNAIINPTGTGKALLVLGSTSQANNGAGLQLLGSSNQTNWLVGSQYNLNNTFEITGSTTVGGSTFTTPMVTITGGTGLVGIQNALTVAGVITASGGLTMGTSQAMLFSNGAGISAAGTTQGTATALTNDNNFVTTVAAGAGVVLPTAVAGREVTVVNRGANALLVYPASGAQIDGAGANIATSMPPNSAFTVNAQSSTQWYAVDPVYAAGTGMSITQSNNGTVTFAATVAPSVANNFTATQTFSGSTSTPAVTLTNATEVVNIVAAAPSATQNVYMATSGVTMFTTAAANNFVLNVAWSAGTTFNTAVATGNSVSLVVDVLQGSTPYYCSGIQIDGSALTFGTSLFWAGGSAPSAGYANGYDRYSINIIKTGASTYVVKAALTQY